MDEKGEQVEWNGLENGKGVLLGEKKEELKESWIKC